MSDITELMVNYVPYPKARVLEAAQTLAGTFGS